MPQKHSQRYILVPYYGPIVEEYDI